MISLLGTSLVLLAQLQALVLPGEILTYEVSSARFGRMGEARFSVSENEGVVRLAFDMTTKVLLLRASDHTASYLDAASLRTLRYTKRERSPLGGRDEDVAIDHAAGTWVEGGKTHPLASPDPLDELSIIYLVRNIRLRNGEERVLTRHFDTARNPIRVRSIASEQVDIVEMHVPDARQNSGVSVLRIHLSRDERSVPLVIESSMPLAGRVTMTLTGAR